METAKVEVVDQKESGGTSTGDELGQREQEQRDHIGDDSYPGIM